MEERQALTLQYMKALEAFDTPTVTNAVATYPGRDTCLGLYEPNRVDWFTDERIRCLYPGLGPRCGFAVTCVYGLPGPFARLGFGDVLRAVREQEAPVILVMKQDMPEKYRRKNALLGGNMLTALKQVGAVGVVADGPARDLEEMRPLKVSCLFTGLTAGHGDMAVEAVNVPVTVCSMGVSPGEVIHMDQNGAVKFPASYLPQVLERAGQIARGDEERQKRLRSTTDPEALSKIMKDVYE